jgi:hypothetical protein
VLKMERAVFEGLGDFRSEAVGLEYLLEPGPKSRKFVSHPSPRAIGDQPRRTSAKIRSGTAQGRPSGASQRMQLTSHLESAVRR